MCGELVYCKCMALLSVLPVYRAAELSLCCVHAPRYEQLRNDYRGESGK